MPRVFVKGISSQTTCADLQGLFSKLCPVSEVYIPGPTETTLRRDFAIITLDGDEELVKKCVKTFNSSVWKGTKLHVELAKEWYRERIEKEKEDQMDWEYSIQLQSQAELEPIVYPPLSKETIALRRIKFQEFPTVISMKPTAKRVKVNPKQRKPVLPCGVKTVFDEDILNHAHLTSSEEDSGSDSEEEKVSKVSAPQSDKPAKVDAKPVSPINASSNEAASIIHKLNSGEMKPIGGGLRKGFGSVTVPVAAPVVPTAPAGTISFADAPSSFKTTGKRGPVDCCIEENELDIPAHLLDEADDSGDDEPCLTEEDLQPEALTRERQRAMDLFSSMVFGPEATTIKPIKAAKDIAKDTVKEAGKQIESAETAKGAKKVNFAAQDEVREIPNNVDAVRNNALSAEEQETLDILNELKANANKPAPVAVSAAPAENSKKSKTLENPPVEVASKFDSAAVTAEPEDILSVKDGYANMNQLKNIFYREGGMWWGDDGTLSGAVAKGSAALDPLFLEAEKHGIDIRLQHKSPAFTLGFQGGGEASTADGTGVSDSTAVPQDDKNMVFSFFGGEDSSMDVADVPVNPFLTKAPAGKPTNSVPSSSTESADGTIAADAGVTMPASVSSGPTSGAKASTVTLTAVETTVVPGAKAKPVEVTFTAAQIVSLAKKFSRQKSVDVLTTEWREGRDRLVLDYKRKRKDMKRRTAAWSSSNTLTVGERAAASSGNNDTKHSSSGTGSGGNSVSGNSRNSAHYMRSRNRGGAGRKKARTA